MNEYDNQRSKAFGRMQAKLEWIDSCLNEYNDAVRLADDEQVSQEFVQLHWEMLTAAIRSGRAVSDDWDAFSDNHFKENSHE